MVNITIDASQLKKLERTLGRIKNGVPRALAPAINRALDKGRTVVKREIRKEYLIKAGDIPIGVKGANQGSLMGEIKIQQGMLLLNKFRFRPMVPGTRRPAWAQVRKGGGGVMPGGFVPAGVGYVGPFIRASGARRLPIHKLLTIGAAIMASQPSVGPEVNKAMGETLAKRIDHEMMRVLARAG